MKKFIKEEYAGLVLQLAHKYINENPDMKGCDIYSAMEKTLETMDMYVAWINNMGFMMYSDSIKAMVQYINQIKGDSLRFTVEKLEEIMDYLSQLMQTE